ncbi:MAG TPA: hypothetical protein VFY69_10215 [Solirubrobacterales bacterium]|nr:hypothetical protein [Solirubrobacterales bacterium]
MASAKTALKSGGGAEEMAPGKEEEARRYIAAVAEAQRSSQGETDFVSSPGWRRLGRRYLLGLIWVWEVVATLGRRVKDPDKVPGRWWSRAKLLRPLQTLSIWTVGWMALAAASGLVVFVEPFREGLTDLVGGILNVSTGEGAALPDMVQWLSRWVFGAAVVALPPELLRQPTLSERSSKVLELEPPVDTVPRDELYAEVLPGAISRERDVQIVMGVPGAGKTTALLDLARVLTKIGLMPVLLEMRGEKAPRSLFAKARERFEEQVRPLVRTAADSEILWNWLCARKRVAILVDDLDQISFDGEPGFAIRRLLEDLADEGQTAIVTARPAGVPVGITASAVTMEELGFETAVELVERPTLTEPGTTAPTQPSRGRIVRWVSAGRLTESPLYLEALAEMNAAGACPDLPDDPGRWAQENRPGRWHRMSAKRREWTLHWVRYLLLSRLYERIVDGRVRPRQGIDQPDRERSMRALEGAALGMLGASGLEARAEAQHGDQPKATREGRPKRTGLVDFISSDDRRHFVTQRMDSKVVRRRQDVSQHEAIDTGERLRVLDRDWQGAPQFRHRIMQAYLAGRQLAELGRLEKEGAIRGRGGNGSEPRIESFEEWVEILMDSHHPEKLTAHLALVFAAIHADESSLNDRADRRAGWQGLGEKIAELLVEEVEDRSRAPLSFALLVAVDRDPAGGAEVRAAGVAVGEAAENPEADLPKQLDPSVSSDPGDRYDYDDDLIKLTTAANIIGLIRTRERNSRHEELAETVLAKIRRNEGGTRWTKLDALKAISLLGRRSSWLLIWEHFTTDQDYDVRCAAGHELERHACLAYPALGEAIEERILQAGARAAEGRSIQNVSLDGGSGAEYSETTRAFTTLGWVLPPIVSGLSEELHVEGGAGSDPGWEPDEDQLGTAESWGGPRSESPEDCLKCARAQLESFTTLAYEGTHHELEESLAQGFKADAWRHAVDPARGFTGPGWVVGNRRLVADVALPRAESWYARMLLHQALALYAVAGTQAEDTLDVTARRLHLSREKHPFVRQAAKLARKAVHRAQIGKERWSAYIWNDEVEGGGRLPTALGRRTAQLVGDVAVLVALKEGSPPDRHVNFGHMEELPHCFSKSPNRYEVLGAGCPHECGWGFCPYRAASPDEPNEHRGLGRSFCKGQQRAAKRAPAWQRNISKRRLREFWKQMEYKARR